MVCTPCNVESNCLDDDGDAHPINHTKQINGLANQKTYSYIVLEGVVATLYPYGADQCQQEMVEVACYQPPSEETLMVGAGEPGQGVEVEGRGTTGSGTRVF